MIQQIRLIRQVGPIEMIGRIRLPSLALILITIFVGLLSVFMGRRIGDAGLSFQTIITIFVGFSVFLVLVLGQRGIQIGFLLWIAMFSLGYRTFPIPLGTRLDQIDPYHVVRTVVTLKFHPLIGIILGLGLLLLIKQVVKREEGVRLHWPILLFVFTIFWPIAWGQGILNENHIDEMLTEFLDFAVLYPIFYLVGYLLRQESAWRSAVTVFFGVGTYIAAFALLEYTVKGFGSIFPVSGFIEQDTTFLAGAEGFVRARFAFWGAPTASFICTLALPMALPLWSWFKKPHWRLILIGALAVQLAGIYIAGYRSNWALTGIVFMIVLAFLQGPKGILGGVTVLALLYSLAPANAQTRFLSFLSATQGNIHDHSSQVRSDRASDALTSAFDNPIGLGWAGAGWVHSDFPQVAANEGLGGGAVFAGWYLLTLGSAFWMRRKFPADQVMFALLISLVAAGGFMVMEGIQVLPQTALPIFFIWAMVHHRTQQLKYGEIRISWDANKSPL